MRFFCLLLLLATHAVQAGAGLQAAPRWYAQRAITADFSFEAQAVQTKAGQFAVTGIRVLERKLSRVIQEIRVDGANDIAADASELLSLVDANQDGRPDLVVPMFFGGTGNIRMADFYLFDSVRARFVRHPALSEMANVEMADGGIQTSSKGAGASGYETFRFRGSEPHKLASGEVVFSPDGKWETTTACRRIKARLRCKTHRQRMAADAAH